MLEEFMNAIARLLIPAVAACVLTAPVEAQNAGCIADRSGKVICGPPDSSCALDRHGEVVCTKPGGGMMNDRYGELLCAPGGCVTDQRGDILCSSQPRGGAMLDQEGKAVCTGGCVPASAAACIRPTAR